MEGTAENIDILPNFLENLGKPTVFIEFWVINPKFCGSCAFQYNFHTRKLGEITVFYMVMNSERIVILEQRYMCMT